MTNRNDAADALAFSLIPRRAVGFDPASRQGDHHAECVVEMRGGQMHVLDFSERPQAQCQLAKWNAEARAEFMADPGNVVDMSERYRVARGPHFEEAGAAPSPAAEIVRLHVHTDEPAAWIEYAIWGIALTAWMVGAIGICLELMR